MRWSKTANLFTTAEIDFVADDPGPTLFHCHHQDHQDEGFTRIRRMERRFWAHLRRFWAKSQ